MGLDGGIVMVVVVGGEDGSHTLTTSRVWSKPYIPFTVLRTAEGGFSGKSSVHLEWNAFRRLYGDYSCFLGQSLEA
jgi:hypothetical protein